VISAIVASLVVALIRDTERAQPKKRIATERSNGKIQRVGDASTSRANAMPAA
jgi:hypothetical protein